jgi:hypothetical protein
MSDPHQPSSISYWRESRQPIYSAVLVLPFLAVYEVGIILLRSEFINGGDAIVRTLFGRVFGMLGFNFSFVSALVLLSCFLVWQFRQKGSWRLQPPVLVALFFESLLYAVLLFVLLYNIVQYLPDHPTTKSSSAKGPSAVREAAARGENKARAHTPAPPQKSAPQKPQADKAPQTDASTRGAAKKPSAQDFVLYCGAGIYEELVFRVGLLGLLILVFTKLFHMEHAYAAAWSVLLGAAIFSAFHHIGGEAFSWSAFLQRMFAGIYFSAIYFNRSFGAAAAGHALFDMIVGLNNLRALTPD